MTYTYTLTVFEYARAGASSNSVRYSQEQMSVKQPNTPESQSRSCGVAPPATGCCTTTTVACLCWSIVSLDANNINRCIVCIVNVNLFGQSE